MSIEITVPQLGESIVEATVGQWRKREGETVVAGEPLVELETDKVNIEVPSPGDGVLTSILKHEGDTVAVGEVLAQISTERSRPAAVSQRAQRRRTARAMEPPQSRRHPSQSPSRQTAPARRPWRDAWPPSATWISRRSAGRALAARSRRMMSRRISPVTHPPPRPPHLQPRL